MMNAIQSRMNQVKVFFFTIVSAASLSAHALGEDSFPKSSKEVAIAVKSVLPSGMYLGVEKDGKACEVISQAGFGIVVRGSSYNNPDGEYDCHGVEGSTCYTISRFRGNGAYAEVLRKNTDTELEASTGLYLFEDYIKQKIRIHKVSENKINVEISLKMNRYRQMNECTVDLTQK